MTSPAALALEDLATTNLRSVSAVREALPRARDAANRVRAALLQTGENPFDEISPTSALRAASFAVSLCENALLKSEASDVYLALWLISGMDPNGETMHTLHYTAAVIQSTRIRLGMSLDDISGEISEIPTAAVRNFLMEFMARNDDRDHVLAAFGLALISDEKGPRFKQKI